MTWPVLDGNRDVIECLERALAEARNGDLVGVVVVGITASSTQGHDWAYRDDAPFPFARLISGLADAQHVLLRDGMEG